MDTEQVAERLSELAEANGWDWAIKLEVAHQCMWSAEIRLTLEPNTPGPDRSFVVYAVGGGTADEVLEKAFRDVETWVQTMAPLPT